MDSNRFIADQGFDRVRQNHFAFAAPAIYGAAWSLVIS